MPRKHNKSIINSLLKKPSKSLSKKLSKSLSYIKRPKNSFMIFAQKYRSIFSKQNPTLTNIEISKLLGNEWFKLSSNDRQYFDDLAANERKEHQVKYPQYKYRPKPAIKSLNSTPTQEMPLMGYFDDMAPKHSNIIFHNSLFPDNPTCTLSHSNNTTDTEEEEKEYFDRLQNYFESVNLEELSEYDDHTILEKPYEHNGSPTVYNLSEECLNLDLDLDVDGCIYSINYDMNIYNQL